MLKIQITEIERYASSEIGLLLGCILVVICAAGLYLLLAN